MHNVTKNKLNTSSGFSLIEILVALAIGAFLIGGISQVYVSLKQTNKVSHALSRLQESARLANDTMLQDISHIGFMGCLDPMLSDSEVNVIYNSAPAYVVNFNQNSISGWDVTSTGWGDSAGLTDIDDSGNRMAILNSDVFRAQFLSRSSLTLSANMANNAANIAISNNIFGLGVGDIAAIGDCRNLDIFQVTGTTEAPLTLAHTAASNSSDSFNGTYTTANTTVRILLNNTYFVGDTGRTNISGDSIFALYRFDRDGNTEEIIEGVENMQVLYGEEIAMDACDPTANQIRFVNASDGTVDMSQVSVVKVGLLLASTERVLTQDDNTTYQVLDQTIADTGTAITYANDRRLRKAVNLTVNIRNRRTTAECVR